MNKTIKEEKELIDITINTELVQCEAEGFLERPLTEHELVDIENEIRESVCMWVQDAIKNVLEFNALLERNAKINESVPHYIIRHKNDFAYQHELKVVRKFTNEKDAKQYIRELYKCAGDTWALSFCDGRSEKLIESGYNPAL